MEIAPVLNIITVKLNLKNHFHVFSEVPVDNILLYSETLGLEELLKIKNIIYYSISGCVITFSMEIVLTDINSD
jgi:hypothetical protein